MLGFPLLVLAGFEYVLWMFDIEAPPEAQTTNSENQSPQDGFDPIAFERQISSEHRRLICLGGSTMAGLPFENRLSMCSLVGQAMGSDVDILNLAGSGKDSADAREVAEIACKHPQTLVLLYSGHNEFLNLDRYTHGVPPEPVQATARFFQRFRFYRLLAKTLASPPRSVAETGEAALSDDEVHQLYTENIRAILDACREQPLIAATVVSNPDFRFPEPGRTILESRRRGGAASAVRPDQTCRHCFRASGRINRILRRLTTEFDVPLIDSRKLLGEAPAHELFWDHVHPKPPFHLAMAEQMLSIATEQGWLQSSAAPALDLTAEELAWATLNRALYNVQFDPALALRQLERIESPPDHVGHAIGRGIAAFLSEQPEQAQQAFHQASEALQSGPDMRAFWADCAGLDGAPPQKGTGGNPCLLRCMPWCAEVLMNEGEKGELQTLVKGIGSPILTRLFEVF